MKLTTKKCFGAGSCGRIFPATTEFFYKSDKTTTGLSNCCIECGGRADTVHLKSEQRRKYQHAYGSTAKKEVQPEHRDFLNWNDTALYC